MENIENLEQAMNFIAKKYVFSKENYPALNKTVTNSERMMFEVRHAILHLNKDMGNLATVCEHYEHGGSIDDVAATKATIKLFIDVLRLAESLDFSADQLLGNVCLYI